MGVQRTKSRESSAAAPKSAASKKASTAKKKASTAKTKASTARTKASTAKTTKSRTTRPTLASLSSQVQALAEQVSELLELVRKGESARSAVVAERRKPTRRAPSKTVAKQSSNGTTKPESFESDLLALLADLDRRGRHSGLIPIPELRDAFVDRGWTRPSFDDRLLQAERDFLVDLKAANDPARLAKPELAIQQPGRGHLQYVVAR